MVNSPNTTGIAPFTPESSFICDTLSIPRGVFLGGCFYTAQQFTAPCHISYINAPTTQYLSVWGVADAEGASLATVYFAWPTSTEPGKSIIGNIIGNDGQYAGCIKSRKTLFTNDTLVVGDLPTFLRGLTQNHQLNSDTLIFDICNCTLLTPQPTTTPNIAQIVVPEDCVLDSDTQGIYYLRPIQPSNTEHAMTTLRIYGGGSGSDLTGTHISLTPRTKNISELTSGSSGSVIASGTAIGVDNDVAIDVVDGAIVITTRGRFATL